MMLLPLTCLLAALAAPAIPSTIRRRRQDDDQQLPPLQDDLPPLPTENTKQRPFGAAKDSTTLDIKNLDSLSKLVSSMPEFSTLATALAKAGLTETLGGGGPFTLFAPTNEAFEKLAPETLGRLLGNTRMLKEVLLRHVIQENIEVSLNIVFVRQFM